MRHPFSTLLFALALTLPALGAHAMTGAERLAAVDKNGETPTDSFVKMTMTITSKDGQEKVREATIKQKGNSKRLFKFESPADMKGVGILVLEDDVMYVYMPAFKKVKRLASSARNDSFMGSDFTYDDMGEMTFVGNYEVTSERDAGESVVLTLEPLKESSPWKHLEMTVRKKDNAHTQVDYFAKKSGEKERTLSRGKFRIDDGKAVADEMIVKDLVKGSSTKIEIREAKSNNGFADDEFSQRYLKRR
ncbi:MAG: outer membrane lipoprotein-sorting protein [Deltaproteobacteria bacterium]|nr:outer membrane lipoprotein-sorting protein [Deltaproteobacteria bacterium]